MKIIRRMLLAVGLVGLLVGVLGAPAGADPLRAKNASVLEAFCPDPVFAVVIGNGEFTPAHILDSTAMFIPTSFNIVTTGEMNGEPINETDTAAKAHPPQPTITCDVVAHFDFPGGFVDISGTATGFVTPAR